MEDLLYFENFEHFWRHHELVGSGQYFACDRRVGSGHRKWTCGHLLWLYIIIDIQLDSGQALTNAQDRSIWRAYSCGHSGIALMMMMMMMIIIIIIVRPSTSTHQINTARNSSCCAS